MNWAIAADNTVVVARFLRQKASTSVKKHKWQKNGGVFKGQHFG